jgi:fructosamine-3-kinase
MSSLEELEAVAAAISAAAQLRCQSTPERSVSGGSINTCYQWRTDKRLLFVKVAAASVAHSFEAEADGLRELASAHAVRVPEVVAVGATENSAFLALEWIDVASERAVATADKILGGQLVVQHRVTADRFGWKRDNFIGSTQQPNEWRDDWLTFFREQRLQFQLGLAAQKGFGALLANRGQRLVESLDLILGEHKPQPSLLHGDLWGGNWLSTADGKPIIFDPAVYYGDREVDLAATHMFGGFGPSFYRAYEEAWPLPAHHEERRELYNLYHVLNHANLFGGSYAKQARSMMDRMLAELGR